MPGRWLAALRCAARPERRIDPDRLRPYRVPGGHVAELLTAWVPTLLLIAAAAFFVCDPWDFSWEVTGSILIGLAITFVIQEIFCKRSPEWTRQRAAERSETPEPAAELTLNAQ